MTRTLKALGLSLFAVLAMGAIAVASASAHEFHAENAPAIVEGDQIAGQPNIFEIGENEGGAKVECAGAHFAGTAANNPTPSITVHPTYTECKFGGNNAEVKTEGCNYVLHGATSAEGHGAVDVECEGTSKIKVIVPSLCTLEIGAQTPAKGVHYENGGAGSSRDVSVTATATGIHYAKKGLFCAFVGGNGEDGTYKGGVTAKGYLDNSGVKGAQQGIWVE